MEEFIDGFRRYGDFTGRATRRQYWMFFLYYFLFSVVANLIDLAMGSFVVSLLFSVMTVIPTISLGTRRLHDIGRSGWWQLLMFVILIGWIVLAVMFAREGEGDNAYGPEPARP
ncbi:DUF805 domain-containing protein [Marinobacter halodurans]|uniref:DUF805 domain-containing protein n=1 Tax=Marinobacter halodurans TaxID=2528979 RepID=A0ABY1ZNG1_9GAMM|nr:DUF805 domain-containing protein [Marinobacter halodurans]TBW58093.1 DUF805 domain-containing protein [Marinobacter halodurans]